MGARLRLLCVLIHARGWRVGNEGVVLVFAVGLGVGVLYGLIRVKSPAPPIVALLGLLEWCLANSLGFGFRQRSSMFRRRVRCLVGERYDRQHPSEAP